MLGHSFVLYLLRICVILATTVSAQSINWVDCSQNVPPPATFLDTTGVNFSALPLTLHCGRIEVPMDFSKPISAANNITLGLAMFRPTNPRGVIFFCPGGTDAGAAAAWRVALNQTGDYFPSFSGLLDYDLMMLDIRGTWSSNKLNVSLDTVNAFAVPYPTNQSAFDAIKAASKTLIQSFDESSSPPGFVRFTGTNEVVQDYEVIRKALGYEKINFLGLSYGSYRAQHYAVKYPHRVGHFVVDAVAPPGLSLFDQANTGILALNRALFRADAYCQNDRSCPLKSKGRGSVPERTPCRGAEFFVGYFCASVYNLQRPTEPARFPVINQALEQLIPGNTSAFGGAGGGGITIDAVVGIPYLCSDYLIEDNTFAGFQKSLEAGSKLDTLKIGQSAAWNLRMYCASWPYPVAPLERLSLKAPMLFVTADFEASTLTEWTTFAWKSAPHSALVVRHGDDNTTFNLPASRATSLEKTFLRTGILPPIENGTEVTVYHSGKCRGPIPDPYDVATGTVAGDCAVENECNLQ